MKIYMDNIDFGFAKGMVEKVPNQENYPYKWRRGLESDFDIFSKSMDSEKEARKKYEDRLLQQILLNLEKLSETVTKNYELSQKIHDDVQDTKNTILNLQLLIKPVVNYPIQITQIITILFGGLSLILLLLNITTGKIFIAFNIGFSILILSIGLFVVSVIRGREIKYYAKDLNLYNDNPS